MSKDLIVPWLIVIDVLLLFFALNCSSICRCSLSAVVVVLLPLLFSAGRNRSMGGGGGGGGWDGLTLLLLLPPIKVMFPWGTIIGLVLLSAAAAVVLEIACFLSSPVSLPEEETLSRKMRRRPCDHVTEERVARIYIYFVKAQQICNLRKH